MEESFGMLMPKDVARDKDGNAFVSAKPYEAYGYRFTGMPHDAKNRKVSFCCPT